MSRWAVIFKCESTAYVSVEADTADEASEIARNTGYFEEDLHKIGRTIPREIKQVEKLDDDEETKIL
jgi:hypothetical protein